MGRDGLGHALSTDGQQAQPLVSQALPGRAGISDRAEGHCIGQAEARHGQQGTPHRIHVERRQHRAVVGVQGYRGGQDVQGIHKPVERGLQSPIQLVHVVALRVQIFGGIGIRFRRETEVGLPRYK
jgi:hypothetical protein